MIQLPPPISTWNILPPFDEQHYRWQRGVVTNGVWSPLLNPKGYEFFNDSHRNLLAKGCRKSSKTICCANRFVRHLWENDGAVGGVIARTIKNGKGGAWNDLTKFVIPGWVAADFGFKVLEEGTDPSSKMLFMRVSNMNGGVSELQLHSLNHEPNVEEAFMALRFSILWFSQAEQFLSVDTYRILLMQLRMEMFGIPRENHQALFDCNPPEDGEDHWLHDVFEKGKIEGSKHFLPEYHKTFASYEFGLDDNYLLDSRDKDELKNTYKSDPVKYDRFVLGKWVRDTSAGHFDEQFRFNIHVKGNADNPDKSKWEIITPHKQARVLITGTDTGDLNHATSFICPRMGDGEDSSYDVFDEVCSIGKAISIREFAKSVWSRVLFWQEWMVKTYGLKEPPVWQHWADSSLWEYSATANNNDAQIFWEVSGKQFGLRPVVKGSGSIRQRIGMTKRLFHDNRLYISAHCRWNISWARFLKPGKAKNQPIADSSKPFNHSFCATSYALGATIPHELQQDDQPSVATGIITT